MLFDMAREVNRLKSEDGASAHGLASKLREMANVLGILQQDPELFLQSGAQVNDDEVAEIEHMLDLGNLVIINLRATLQEQFRILLQDAQHVSHLTQLRRQPMC